MLAPTAAGAIGPLTTAEAGTHLGHIGAGVGLPDAVQVNLISGTDLEIGAGNDGTLETAQAFFQNRVSIGIKGENLLAFFVGDGDGTAGFTILGKLQIHGHLLRVAFRPVHGRAESHDGAAVNERTQIAVQTRVGGRLGTGNNITAVDHQVAVGVDAVALFSETGQDTDFAAVDGGDGNIVLVGVDAVVAGADDDIAAVDGQVQLGIQTLVFRVQFQTAGASNIHGHIGIDGTVLLPQLLFAFFVLIDLGYIGAVDGIFAFRGQNQIGTGGGGIHIRAGGIRIPVAVALVDIQKHNGRGHGAGDIHAV